MGRVKAGYPVSVITTCRRVQDADFCPFILI